MAALKAVDAHTIPWAQDGYLCHFDLSEEASGTNGQEDDCTVSLKKMHSAKKTLRHRRVRIPA